MKTENGEYKSPSSYYYFSNCCVVIPVLGGLYIKILSEIF
jgi:hypothetical protein